MKKFADLAGLFENIENTSSRNEISEKLAEFYTSASIKESQIFPYLLMGRVAPLFVPAEFHFSEKGLIKVIQDLIELNGLSINSVKMREDVGDIGVVAMMTLQAIEDARKDLSQEELVRISDKGTELTIEEVYEKLWEIVNIAGEGSISRKSIVVSELLQRGSPLEAKYLCRIITGKLRLGASDKTVIDALSYTIGGDKNASSKLYGHYGVDPDIGNLSYRVGSIKEKDLDEVIEPTLGIPILSRLVERVKSFDEVFERLGGNIYLQPKFDGIRCQVHKGVDYSAFDLTDRVWLKYFMNKESEDNLDMFGEVDEDTDIRLFSRNLEDITDMFPDVVKSIEELNIKNGIFDCEIVGWSESKETFIPFQETMTRKRKYDVADASAKVPVRLYIFDLLYLNGQSLLDVDLSERIENLEEIDFSNSNFLYATETSKIKGRKELDKLFNDAVEANLEGVIVKQPGGGYQPGKRNYEWLKLKKSMDKKLVDSVDVVIMGYYYGSGKQVTAGMGALLAGILSEDGKIRSVTKIGTGVTDEQWKIIAERLNQIETDEKPSIYHDVTVDLKPDMWVLPEVVSSVEADEITKSKAHMAATDQGDYGLALRFPRLIQFDRDKNIEDATTTKELVKMYKGGI